jgi:hypothetical protein
MSSRSNIRSCSLTTTLGILSLHSPLSTPTFGWPSSPSSARIGVGTAFSDFQHLILALGGDEIRDVLIEIARN